MASLLFASDQRFTCAQCGRCCHRTTVPVTADEAAAYRKAGAWNWFDEGDGTVADETRDPFETIPGHAPLLRVRKRVDGACGFLTAAGRCRIHEVLGADRKPVACRMFPFSFRPTEGGAIVTASFACPTVIASEGATLQAQTNELRALHVAWKRTFPEPAAPFELARGRPITRAAVGRMRTLLVDVLDRPDPARADGRPDLRANLRRIAALLEDWTRWRVLRLAPDDFLEYIGLTGRYAATNDKPARVRPAGAVPRLLFRGFLLAVLGLQARLDPAFTGRRTALSATLAGLLAHLHGFGPPVGGFRLRRAMRVPLDLDDAAVHAIVHRYLRTALETLGATRRPIVDEMAMRVSQLNAACVIAGNHASAAGRKAIDADGLSHGLLAAADLSHGDAGGRMSALLTTLTGGLEALYLFPPTAAASSAA